VKTVTRVVPFNRDLYRKYKNISLINKQKNKREVFEITVKFNKHVSFILNMLNSETIIFEYILLYNNEVVNVEQNHNKTQLNGIHATTFMDTIYTIIFIYSDNMLPN